MLWVRSLLVVLLSAITLTALHAEATLPSKPADYVLDQSGVFSAEQQKALGKELEDFERATSNQLLVAVIPQVPEDYVLEDFTQRTAESWGVGQKEHDNGIVLFVFPESRKVRIEVGYGLEGAVPDALANRIIQDEIIPAFRANDMPRGIVEGVRALMEASKGEYEAKSGSDGLSPATILMILFVAFVIILLIKGASNGGSGGRTYRGGSGGWTSSQGGGGFSGSGGFSGGGGSFGGGGASGSW